MGGPSVPEVRRAAATSSSLPWLVFLASDCHGRARRWSDGVILLASTQRTAVDLKSGQLVFGAGRRAHAAVDGLSCTGNPTRCHASSSARLCQDARTADGADATRIAQKQGACHAHSGAAFSSNFFETSAVGESRLL